jgi:putative NADH-flavin reductase
MRFGILGATGPTGKELLKKLKGKTVSAYVRNPSRLPEGHGAEVVQGELSDEAKLQDWAGNQDVILCALGHGLSFSQILANLSLGSYPQAGMLEKTWRIVLKAKPKRVVHCSAYGTQETRGDLPFVFGKILLPLLIAKSYEDHEHVERLLQSSSTEWVVARPGMLTNGEAKGVYQTVDRFTGKGTKSISRADVADFMVKAATTPTYLRKLVGLGY